EAVDVAELGDQAVQVADPVAVTGVEGADEHLVADRAARPGGGREGGPVLRRRARDDGANGERCGARDFRWTPPSRSVHPPSPRAAWRLRSNRRGASIRSTTPANAGVGPFQRRTSTSANRGASVRSVARFLNTRASDRPSPSTVGGNCSIGPY